ncbi:hypothetical protein S7335_895 [Synechococcus sp. PCC 7335]|uniref:hypothetical protein n=1 Tax=Synechococcus sp. (strain ATCC 29403 / PCC 7335) TaxID=91464 RepID=UPI00017EC82B|nr:hypothetical protein [Synechococcus sp. PCC 7335]EDX82338.1 hypothetical protein S7335_895 [Synechococcus sp. PCC 7335]
MAFTRESLNAAISHKLADIDTASGMHKALFTLTQAGGLCCAAGAVLVAPLAVEVALIAGAAGATLYGISQLLQSQRLGYFLPLPGVPVSAEQFAYVPGVLVSQLMASGAPIAPEPVEIIPTDWLPQRERRINYLLTHTADLLIAAAENAQEGISFAAIVDSAVRASEYAISDEQISNPVVALKLAPDVRALLQGDTTKLEAKQRAAIESEWQRAQQEHAAGLIASDELKAIAVEVEAIAPDVMTSSQVIAPAVPDPLFDTPNETTVGDRVRTDWQAVFGLVKDQDTYPAIAVIGAQGLGKTTLIEYLLSLLRGDKIVLDPHYQAGAWPGCLVIGAGMDYAAVSEALANLSADVKERYQQRATFAGYKPAPVALVLEEQTNWVDKVDGAGKFLKETLSDIRKVGYQTFSVAHGDTNTARGGAKGTAKMRAQGELKIEILEQGLAQISLRGRDTFLLRYPDPSPFTLRVGQPRMATGGQLGPGYCDADLPSPSNWGCPETTAPIASVEPLAAPSQWELCKQHSSIPGLVAVMEWIEVTSKTQFTPREARANKKLRPLFASEDDLRAIFETLVEYELLTRIDGDSYERSPL